MESKESERKSMLSLKRIGELSDRGVFFLVLLVRVFVLVMCHLHHAVVPQLTLLAFQKLSLFHGENGAMSLMEEPRYRYTSPASSLQHQNVDHSYLFLTLDTSELLFNNYKYETDRSGVVHFNYYNNKFPELKNWDSAHFDFISRFGYSHENIFVFFPFLPFLFRVCNSFLYLNYQVSTGDYANTEVFNNRLFYYLHSYCGQYVAVFASSSLLISLLNCATSALCGVVLKRVLVLTILGPEANDISNGKGSKESNERVVKARVLQDSHGTLYDNFSSLFYSSNVFAPWICDDKDSEHSGSEEGGEGGKASDVEKLAYVEAYVRLAKQISGGAVLFYAFTPSAVFHSVAYTEAFFAFFSLLSFYHLAEYASITCASTSSASHTHSTNASATVSELESLPIAIPAHGSRGNNRAKIQFRQRFCSRKEALALLWILSGSWIRSNNIIAAGFFIYPFFLLAVLPTVYEKRVGIILGKAYHDIMSSSNSNSNSSNNENGSGDGGANEKREYVVSTDFLPLPSTVKRLNKSTEAEHRRYCSYFASCVFIRFLFVLAEVVVLALPYLYMNAKGWERYGFLHQNTGGSRKYRFYHYYTLTQAKFWDVGLFHSFKHAKNAPNVALAFPLFVVVTMCSYCFYLRPFVRHYVTRSRKGKKGVASFLFSLLLALCQSASIVYFMVISLFGFALIHIQVTNRFVGTSSALYVLVGALLANYKKRRMYKSLGNFVLVWCSLYMFLGSLFFANHLPWT